MIKRATKTKPNSTAIRIWWGILNSNKKESKAMIYNWEYYIR